MQINRSFHPGLRASHLQLKKFKTVQCQLRFFASSDERDATVRTLMFHMMKAKTQKYPSRRLMTQQMETLYDLHLSNAVSLMGQAHVATMSVSFAHPRYLNQPTYLTEVLSFMKEVLYAPLFDEATLIQEKQFLRDYFDGIYASKARYANKRFWDTILAGHPDHLHAYGSTTQLESITLQDIKQAHQALLTENPIHVSVVGDLEGLLTLDDMLVQLELTPRDEVWPALKHLVNHQPKANFYDLEPVTQERVYMAYDLAVFYGDEDYYAAIVLNQILGEGSESLLFQEIRERQSMAYDVHSSLAAAWGLLIVQAGVSYENLARMVEITEAIIKDLKTVEVEEEQLDLAKKTLLHGITQSYDAAKVLNYRLLREDLLNIPFAKEKAIEKIQDVSINDVLKVAQKLNRLMIYTLGGMEDGQTHLSSL